jgi:hypothetical protein
MFIPHHCSVVGSAQDKTPSAEKLIGGRKVNGKTLGGEGDLL